MYHLLRFGVFELNLDLEELRKNGTLLKLPPQPFKLLALLASRSGQVVTRDEIQEQLWGNDTFIDFEQGVNKCIKQIRTALSDNPDNPLYLETIPRQRVSLPCARPHKNHSRSAAPGKRSELRFAGQRRRTGPRPGCGRYSRDPDTNSSAGSGKRYRRVTDTRAAEISYNHRRDACSNTTYFSYRCSSALAARRRRV